MVGTYIATHRNQDTNESVECNIAIRRRRLFLASAHKVAKAGKGKKEKKV